MIITLPVIAYFQWVKYKRFHPPTDYEFALNDSIDVNYHDPDVILQYYLIAEQVGTYARNAWKEFGVDVKVGSNYKPTEQQYVNTYQQMIAKGNLLEGKLLSSARLKSKGWTNDQIKQWENGTFTQKDLTLESWRNNPILARIEDKSAMVFNIQKLLIDRGYEIPHDGIFREETTNAIRSFQESEGIYPNGIATLETVNRLLK